MSKTSLLTHTLTKISLFLGLIVLAASCNAVKHLQEDDLLLTENTIEVDGKKIKDPDAYSLIFGNMGPEVLNWAMQAPESFAVEDYFYFGRVDTDPGCLFVGAESPLKTLDDVIAEGKKRTLFFYDYDFYVVFLSLQIILQVSRMAPKLHFSVSPSVVETSKPPESAFPTRGFSSDRVLQTELAVT